MTFKLGLAQCTHPEDKDVPKMVEEYARKAKAQNVDLLVFPESLMTSYEKELGQFLEEAQPLDGPFTQAIDALAKKYELWILYTVNERNDACEEGAIKPFNTAVIVDADGVRRGVYRKTHLFDTDFTHESDRMSSGDKLFSPIDTPFGKIGMAICYDLRFPEVARYAALRGCQLLVYPAAWVSGNTKIEQWKTLLSARAIENEMFVAGVSRTDKGYIGHSCIFDPTGTAVAAADGSEALLVAEIDTKQIDDVRWRMPVFQHRREELY